MNMTKVKSRREIIAEIKEKEIKKEENKKKYAQIVKKVKMGVGALVSFFRKIKKYFSKSIDFVIRFYKKNIIERFGKFKKRLEKNADLFQKKIFNFLKQIVLCCVAVLAIFNIAEQLNRFKGENLANSVRKVNYWPTLSNSNLNFAEKMLELGDIELAKKYLTLSKNSFFILNSDKYLQVEELILKPEKKQKELNLLENKLEKYSYSWELVLTRCKLESELFYMQNSKKCIEILNWINPKKTEKYKKQLSKNY